jgi:biopolymer transport protein ExbB/TolQ
MNWIVAVEWGARVILLGLVGMSIWSISIILERRKFFAVWKELTSLDDLKEELQNDVSCLDDTIDPRASYLKTVANSPIENHENLFNVFINESQKRWKKGLDILGTLGSITPFIGLLGTILGIIVSFGELSKGSADMKGVMFSLAEALILTAVGLGVAIPAVIAFNHFNKVVNSMVKDVESAKELYKTFARKS